MSHKNQKLFAKGLEYQVLFYFKKNSSKQVFKALRRHPSTKLEQEVLVKIFLEDLYKEEFESLSKVDSPYCVRLLGFENFGSKKALVLEYVKGVSLFQLLEHFHLKGDEKSYILSEIYKGLKDIHSFGLCHGDLSLDNVLIDEKAQIKLIDFGQGNYKKSHYGTTPFVAPEILKGLRPQFLSDLYSLGVIEALLQHRIRLSNLSDLNADKLQNTSLLLSTDPVKRSFVHKSSPDFDKSSLVLKVQELLSATESRRCSTVKNFVLPRKKSLMTFFKLAFLSLFFAGFLGGSHQKSRQDYGLIKIYTHQWFFIENSEFQSYTPAHFLLKQGSYWLRWKSRFTEGQKKIYVAKEKILVLSDEFFLSPSKKPTQAHQTDSQAHLSLFQKGIPKDLKHGYTDSLKK